MTDEKFQDGKFIAISDCEICKHLKDEEFSFFKYAHEEETKTLPAAADRLGRLKDSRVSKEDRREFRRCPVCGTFYLYKFTYEYLATGSEDEEDLERATPAQARRFLTDKAYDDLMTWMTANLHHAEAATRFFAAKCLVAHHLERREMPAIAQYLQDDDGDVVKGALVYLAQSIRDRFVLDPTFWQLHDLLLELSGNSEPEVASYAAYLARNITRYAKRAGPEAPNAKDAL